MANAHVWSGATAGANDGTSWQDAFLLVGRNYGALAGFTPGVDKVFARSDHAENHTSIVDIDGFAGETVSGGLPVEIISVVGADTGTDPGVYQRGASIETTNTFRIDRYIRMEGFDFRTTQGFFEIAKGSLVDHDIQLADCRFDGSRAAGVIVTIGQLNAGRSVSVSLENVWWKTSGGTSAYFDINQNAVVTWSGGKIWESDGGQWRSTGLITWDNNINPTQSAMFRGVDFEISSDYILRVTGNEQICFDFVLEDCKLSAGLKLFDTGATHLPHKGQHVQSFRTQSGISSDPSFEGEWVSAYGVSAIDDARYRTGGSTDGNRATPYSVDMQTTFGRDHHFPGNALISPPLTAKTPGDGVTPVRYRLYLATLNILLDNEVWAVFWVPNDLATDSLRVSLSTQMATLAAPANLASDTESSWDGDETTTKHYIEVSHVPMKPGLVTANLFISEPSIRVSLDGRIWINE